MASDHVKKNKERKKAKRTSGASLFPLPTPPNNPRRRTFATSANEKRTRRDWGSQGKV